MGIRQGFKDFTKGLSILLGKSKEGEGKGDRKLAKVSLMVEGMISSQTKHEIRRRVIGDIEKTLAKEAKKGGKPAVDQKVAISLQTPEYVRMLHRLGLEEAHIRVMAMEAVKNAK